MSTVTIPKPPRPDIIYPDSDGQPMAENTEQFEWIVKIKEGLEIVFSENPNVFVAGDLLWYPVEGKPEICTAPDTLVVFGRPKGRRGSYIQFREDGIPPRSSSKSSRPATQPAKMTDKFRFYEEIRG